MSNLQLIEKNGTQKVVPKNIQNTKDEKKLFNNSDFFITHPSIKLQLSILNLCSFFNVTPCIL